MNNYRVEKRSVQEILLPDAEAEIPPVPTGRGGGGPEPEMVLLSKIIKEFNDLFGNIDWENSDRVIKLITETIPSQVAEDAAFQNASQNSDNQNARVEHSRVLQRVMTSVLNDDMTLFKQYTDNEDFKRWMVNEVFDRARTQAEAR